MEMTSVVLGTHFENFIRTKISQGQYSNASEVICAGLSLLEDNEKQVIALKTAIDEGVGSGIAEDFDPCKHLQSLKTKRVNG